MIASTFRSNRPAVLLLLPVLLGALFAPGFAAPVAPSGGLMPLAALVEELLGGATWSRQLFGLVLIAVLSIQLAALVNALELMDRRNHLVAFFFPVLLACFDGASLYGPALLGMPIVLVALRRTWSMDNNGAVLGVLFDAGVLLGIASLCYLPYAFLFAVVWASTSVIRPFAWREYVLPIVGLCLVFYVCWGILALMGHTPWHPLLTLAQPVPPTGLFSSTAGKVFSGIMVLVLMASLAAFSKGYARSIMRGKNLRSAFLAFSTALGLLALLLWLLNGSFPPVLAVTPMAVLTGYAFLDPKRSWLAEFGAATLLGFALWFVWSG